MGFKPNGHIRCFITFRLVFGQLTTFCGYFVCVSVSVSVFFARPCVHVWMCLSCSDFAVALVTSAVFGLHRSMSGKTHSAGRMASPPWLKMNLLTEFV